jgi:hypothetical protein
MYFAPSCRGGPSYRTTSGENLFLLFLPGAPPPGQVQLPETDGVASCSFRVQEEEMKVALPIPDWGEISRSHTHPRRKDRPIPTTSSLNVSYEGKEEDSLEDWVGELDSHLEEALAA